MPKPQIIPTNDIHQQVLQQSNDQILKLSQQATDDAQRETIRASNDLLARLHDDDRNSPNRRPNNYGNRFRPYYQQQGSQNSYYFNGNFPDYIWNYALRFSQHFWNLICW